MLHEIGFQHKLDYAVNLTCKGRLGRALETSPVNNKDNNTHWACSSGQSVC